MATDFDPYRILGIDRTAFSDDIFNAYQRAIAEHPNDAQAQREIEAAYAILSNFEQRRDYDARVREREVSGAQPVSADAISAAAKSSGDPRDDLRLRIESLVKIGFEFRTAAGDAAYLTKRNEFAWGWAVFWALLGLLPLIIYLFHYSSKRVESVYLWIDSAGVLHQTHSELEPPDSTLEALGIPKPQREDVPWTFADMAKALILPAILVGLNLIAFIAGDTDTEDLTEGEWIVNFGFGFLIELAFLGLAWHFGIRKYGLTWRAFGFFWPKNTGAGVWVAVILGPFALLYAYILPLAALGVEPEGNIPENVYDYAIPVIMLGILSVVMAPFVEEVFFRAFLFQGFAKKWGVVAGIAISAIIFGSAHVASVDSLIVAPAIAGIGAVFAWAYWKSGSIYPSMIAHVIFNAISFTGGFFIE